MILKKNGRCMIVFFKRRSFVLNRRVEKVGNKLYKNMYFFFSSSPIQYY